MRSFDADKLRDTVTAQAIEIYDLRRQLEDANWTTNYYLDKLAEGGKTASKNIEEFGREEL